MRTGQNETLKIGVIGAGAIGGTLSARWSSHGHSVRVANSPGADVHAAVIALNRSLNPL